MHVPVGLEGVARADIRINLLVVVLHAAVVTERLFLSVVIHARTESQDLQWQFDAVARLGEAQTLGQTSEANIQERLSPHRFLSPGPLWWAFDWESAQAQWHTCANPAEPVPQRPDAW